MGQYQLTIQVSVNTVAFQKANNLIIWKIMYFISYEKSVIF